MFIHTLLRDGHPEDPEYVSIRFFFLVYQQNNNTKLTNTCKDLAHCKGV